MTVLSIMVQCVAVAFLLGNVLRPRRFLYLCVFLLPLERFRSVGHRTFLEPAGFPIILAALVISSGAPSGHSGWTAPLFIFPIFSSVFTPAMMAFDLNGDNMAMEIIWPDQITDEVNGRLFEPGIRAHCDRFLKR